MIRRILAAAAGLALGALVLVAVYQLKVQAARCAEIQPPDSSERAAELFPPLPRLMI